jgi:hypothetical protein
MPSLQCNEAQDNTRTYLQYHEFFFTRHGAACFQLGGWLAHVGEGGYPSRVFKNNNNNNDDKQS